MPNTAAGYDAILIGAGGAGMCLLLAMHERRWLTDKRVLILEPDPKDGNDRTWCFWAKDSDPIAASLGPLASCHWDYTWINGEPQPLHPYRYYHLRSADFYRHVKQLLAGYPLVEWRHLPAGVIAEAEAGLWVEAGGELCQAQWVFDSRLRPEQQQGLREDERAVWQSFVGWRVRFPTDRADPAAIRLMDFSVAQDGAAQFMYLLPTAADEMLVEITRFGTASIRPDRAASLLEDWLGRHLGDDYEILETEAGCIPMNQRLNAPAPAHEPGARHIPIGTAAGAVKSSTGYALSRMFAHACGIVEALEKSAPCPAPYQAPRFAFYDSLLLHILARQPEQGQPIFEQLFERVPLRRVLAFLDEKSSLRQDIPLLLSLPIRPFLQALAEVYLRPGAWPRLSLGGALPLLIAALALLLQYAAPQALQSLGAPLLLLGMAFPGIPHGALDHCLSPAGQLQGGALLRFVVGYLAIMGLILLVWLLSPPLALLAFLLYSAWHFGETDLQHWGAFRPGRAWLHGAAALGFILAAHPGEFEAYLHALGLGPQLALPPLAMTGIAGASLLGLLGTGLFIPAAARASWLQTMLILLAGAFLPLLLAFGLYFIGVHSLRGWRHLQAGLRVSHAALLRQALPFSLGAFALFALLVAFSYLAELPFEGVIPGLFVFLAAISAPHIWFMHRFYGGAEW